MRLSARIVRNKYERRFAEEKRRGLADMVRELALVDRIDLDNCEDDLDVIIHYFVGLSCKPVISRELDENDPYDQELIRRMNTPLEECEIIAEFEIDDAEMEEWERLKEEYRISVGLDPEPDYCLPTSLRSSCTASTHAKH